MTLPHLPSSIVFFLISREVGVAAVMAVDTDDNATVAAEEDMTTAVAKE